ncbi:MAG TPA: NUDIX domain-containing protein [Stellaceae bacterium]|jgi:predicted NUDIX family NTP pyrophosphohydrolase|nr:NUDIX domain-containing protein [Stellaceae bacterium]
MAKQSAGVLLYRFRERRPEVFLVHPGGPFWAGKDAGAWSIPKGEAGPGEDLLTRAKLEFAEETGFAVPDALQALRPIKQAGGKVVHAWAAEGNVDAAALRSNGFTLEWPPRSGRQQIFPEVDRAAWFTLAEAREKINKGQSALLDQLEQLLAIRSNPD